jgi:hypothetical protein
MNLMICKGNDPISTIDTIVITITKKGIFKFKFEF